MPASQPCWRSGVIGTGRQQGYATLIISLLLVLSMMIALVGMSRLRVDELRSASSTVLSGIARKAMQSQAEIIMGRMSADPDWPASLPHTETGTISAVGRYTATLSDSGQGSEALPVYRLEITLDTGSDRSQRRTRMLLAAFTISGDAPLIMTQGVSVETDGMMTIVNPDGQQMTILEHQGSDLSQAVLASSVSELSTGGQAIDSCDELSATSDGIYYLKDSDCMVPYFDIGSADDPVILIVENGDVMLNGGTFYGVLYMTSPAGELILTGNGTLRGAVVVDDAGGIVRGVGVFTLIYDKDVLSLLPDGTLFSGSGGVSSEQLALLLVPGSWRDF